MKKFIVARTGKTRRVRGLLRFWKLFVQHEVIIEEHDENHNNRSQYTKWVDEDEEVLSKKVLTKS